MDAVLNWLFQGAAVAAAAFVMFFALRRVRANVRYMVCWAALLLIVAIPTLPAPQSMPIASETFAAAAPDAIVSLPDVWWTSTLLLVAAWGAWVAVQVMRFVLAIVAISRARARSHVFPPSLEARLLQWRRVRSGGRRARLVVSNSVTTAAVLGWGAPMIAVAPSLVRTLDPEDLDRVLIHEWVHVQRRDDVANVLQIVVRIVAGWHPALWWIDRRLHVEREIACDEMTVAITGSPKSYAACLVTLAGLAGTRRTLQAAPAAYTPSGLRTRVVKIVSPLPSMAPVWSRSAATAIVLTLCLMSVTMAGMTLVEAAAFAQPLLSARTLSGTFAVPVAFARAVVSERTADASPRRTLVRSSSAQRHRAEAPAPLPPATQSSVPPIQEPPKTVDPPRAPGTKAEPAPPSATPPAIASVPQTSPAPPAPVADQSRSPWSAAAEGGATIGKKSKDAGVATAGFFKRFAHRVAGSF